MKVAILTLFYKNYNYGGVLQGYALKEYINNVKGSKAHILKYKDGRNPIYASMKEQLKQYGVGAFVGKLWEKGLEKFTFLIEKKIEKRMDKFEEFIEEHSYGKEYIDENIVETCEEYDCFISGSDQVWNPNCIRDGFLQTFVGENKVKASYAASIGRDKLTEKEVVAIASELEKFDYISVREESAKKILAPRINKEISLVLDPVFLLKKEQWKVVNMQCKKPYVLCYFFSNSTKIREQIKKSLGEEVDLLFIPYVKQKYNIFDCKGPGKRLYDVGPKDFVSLVAGAECVYTDSFHGTAFSIIFNRPFYVFGRDKDKDQTSMNSRLYNILHTFGLENRLINVDKITENISDIDYVCVNEILAKKREESQKILERILDDKQK